VVRVGPNCLLQDRDSLANRRRVLSPQLRERAHYEIIGLEAHRRFATRSFDLGLPDRRLQSARDLCRDPILEIEDLAGLTLEAVRPQLVSRRDIDELNGDSQ